jgi:glycosyltransferase involved in cell wall biosynthesis
MEYAPLVSIITIVFNGEKHIEDTIKSVIDQTYRNIEFIIIDGGSTDNTLEIIGKYAYAITSFLSEHDEGISDAFNKGLNLAKGEIIGIINADDWYVKNAVEMAVKNIEYSDIVYGNLRLWKDDKPDFIVTADHAYLENEMSVNHPTVFIKKECYEKYGLFDKKYKCAMDYDLMLRLKINNCRFVYIPEVLANMRWAGFSDANWLLGCRETRMIKDDHLPASKYLNQLYFFKHVLGITVPRFLTRIRMGFLVRLYRSRLARIKKIYG